MDILNGEKRNPIHSKSGAKAPPAPTAQRPGLSVRGKIRRRVRSAVIIGVLFLQIGIPAVQLSRGDPPLRFGWQMYSSAVDWPEIEAVDNEGITAPIDRSDIYVFRMEIRADQHLAAALCASDPLIARVRFRSSGTTEEFTCVDL
ncbi:MAG: hypothetical protein M0026_19710 [Nocardiopsaceae bacterium]|nr:hypothetical protein [Nocardiopsaceae bacterium]